MQRSLIMSYAGYCFDTTGSELKELEQRLQEISEGARGQKFYCHLCGCLITYENQRISINGNHSHVRTNPAGVTFELGCFQAAPGCVGLGESTIEHTWFSGYRWQIAVCRSCGEQLGWLFRQEGIFYGLILARLVGEGPS